MAASHFRRGPPDAREQLTRLAREGVRARGNRVIARRVPAGSRSLDALLWKM